MAASAPVLGTAQDTPRPIPWTYKLTPEDEMEIQTAIEHFSGRTLVGRLVGSTPSRPTVREWIESALGGSTARILELSMMTAGLFLLQLSDSVSTDALLARSPISSGSRLLVFQRWTPQFDQDEFDRQQQIPRFHVTLSFPSLPIFMRRCIPCLAASVKIKESLVTFGGCVSGLFAQIERATWLQSPIARGTTSPKNERTPFDDEASSRSYLIL
ncbi:hypothetical protein L7F22_022817 [Adiantum nelumboides]|nr:hypothetical protein [Adiantum nelumboides]